MDNDIDTTDQLEQLVNALSNKIASAADKCIPHKTIDLQKNEQLSDEIKNLIWQRNTLRKWFQASRNTTYEQDANQLRGISVRDGSIWRLTRNLRRSRPIILPLKKPNGDAVTSTEIAEEIANGFEAFYLTPETSPGHQDTVNYTVSSFLTNNPANPSDYPAIQYLCSGLSAEFYFPDCEYNGLSCLNCDSQKMCVLGWYWSNTPCANDLAGHSNPYCNPETNMCTNIRPEGCPRINMIECLRDDIFPDTNDCTTYYTCINSTAELLPCPENFVYKHEFGKCVFKLSNDNCIKMGTCGIEDFVEQYPGDPSLYYGCESSTFFIKACFSSEFFNMTSKTCDTRCSNIGRLPNSQNCMKYYDCEKTEGGFVAVESNCPEEVDNTNCSEIRKEIFRKFLTALDIPEEQVPFVLEVLKRNVLHIIDQLNGYFGWPIFVIDEQSNIRIAANVLHEAVTTSKALKDELESDNIYVKSTKQEYLNHHQEIIEILQGLYLNLDV
ncbi:hypothetical protein Trydic_g17117 [Trypoxylus dichotomus]